MYLAHSVWEWNGGKGRESADVIWIDHTDKVLVQLIGIGDELCRFLTMPTSTGTRHRIMASGHKEAAEIMQVSSVAVVSPGQYGLFASASVGCVNACISSLTLLLLLSYDVCLGV